MSIQSSFNQLLGIGAVAAGAITQSPTYKLNAQEESLRAKSDQIKALKGTLQGTDADIKEVTKPLQEKQDQEMAKFSEANPSSPLASEYYQGQLDNIMEQRRQQAEAEALQKQKEIQANLTSMKDHIAQRKAMLKKRRGKKDGNKAD